MTTAIPKRCSTLPPVDEMYQALCDRDSQYEGVFFVGVRTTGIFCRPTCSARKPKLINVDFYHSANDALSAGFRPCKKCRPLEVFAAMPDWLRDLLDQFEADVERRWTDADIRAHGAQPDHVRRWFKQHLGITFHGYMRSRRLANAIGQNLIGKPVTSVATKTAIDSSSKSVNHFNEAIRNWSSFAPAKSGEEKQPIIVNRISTPLGPMVAAAVDDQLGLLEFADRRMLETQIKRLARIYQRFFINAEHPIIAQIQTEMNEYFDRQRKKFDVPLARQGTEFQQQVWGQLSRIPFGETVSYHAIARSIKNQRPQRAFCPPTGDNRLAIVIPCHRVIRSDGSISNYGGQVWRKKWLLEFEQQTEQ